MSSKSSPSWAMRNSISMVFGVLLLGSLMGQAFFGVAGYNQEARQLGLQQIGLWSYVFSSEFAVDVAENWQSEYLQFTLYILLTVWFLQEGSSESNEVGQQGRGSDKEQLIGRYSRPDSPKWAKVGGGRLQIFSHSLTIAMATVFLLSWTTQAVTGRVANNAERLRDLQEPLSLGAYAMSPDFWGRTLQNWQSEFLAIGSMAVFAVFLRERGSPESKVVGAPNDETGS